MTQPAIELGALRGILGSFGERHLSAAADALAAHATTCALL
ncbi:MAG TPA: hypothetical protein PKB14_26115 [Rubrivivax sp.]|nr:hypothetical protein [Rubrivivax sp.]